MKDHYKIKEIVIVVDLNQKIWFTFPTHYQE